MQDFHPILVHIPVTAIPLAVAFGLWRLTNRKSTGIRYAFRVCLVVAAVFSLAAYLSGNKAEEHVEKIVPAALLEAHEEFGTWTFWLILTALAIEALTFVSKLVRWRMTIQALAFVASFAALVTVALAGHRGAEMVFKYGAGVGEVFGPSPNVTVAPATAAAKEGED